MIENGNYLYNLITTNAIRLSAALHTYTHSVYNQFHFNVFIKTLINRSEIDLNFKKL